MKSIQTALLTWFITAITTLLLTHAQANLVEACRDAASLPELAQCILQETQLSIYETCQSNDNLIDFVGCVIDNVNPQCIDETTPFEILQCLEELEEPPSDFKDFMVNSGCFDQVLTCVRTRVEEFLDDMPSCVQESLTTFAHCIVENKETCATTCSGVTLSPIESTSIGLATCLGVQEQIMDPLCVTISCCQPCVAPFEEVARCIVNQVIDLTPVECNNLKCPEARRILLRGKFFGRFGFLPTTPTAPDDWKPLLTKLETCLVILVPGQANNAHEAIADFFECLADAIVKV